LILMKLDVLISIPSRITVNGGYLT
jgi:hypothetical protein